MYMKKSIIVVCIFILAGCGTTEKMTDTGDAEKPGTVRAAGETETIKKNTVVPGRGVGNFLLNKTPLDYFYTHKKEVATYTEMGFWFEFNKQNILSLIGTINPGVETIHGIQTGDTEEKVLHIYGEPVKKDFEKKIFPREFPGFDSLFDYILIYNDILFYINEHRVEAFAVFSPGFLD
jgi:hypothetical protein